MKCKPLPCFFFLSAQSDTPLGSLFKGFTFVGKHIVKNYKHREVYHQVLPKGLLSSGGPFLTPDTFGEIHVCFDSLGSEILYHVLQTLCLFQLTFRKPMVDPLDLKNLLSKAEVEVQTE